MQWAIVQADGRPARVRRLPRRWLHLHQHRWLLASSWARQVWSTSTRPRTIPLGHQGLGWLCKTRTTIQYTFNRSWPFENRFTDEASSSAFTRTMATSLVPAIPAFWATWRPMPTPLLAGTWTTSSWMVSSIDNVASNFNFVDWTRLLAITYAHVCVCGVPDEEKRQWWLKAKPWKNEAVRKSCDAFWFASRHSVLTQNPYLVNVKNPNPCNRLLLPSHGHGPGLPRVWLLSQQDRQAHDLRLLLACLPDLQWHGGEFKSNERD